MFSLLVSLAMAQELPRLEFQEVNSITELVRMHRDTVVGCFSNAIAEHYNTSSSVPARASVIFFVDDDGVIDGVIADAWSWEEHRDSGSTRVLRPNNGPYCLKTAFKGYRVTDHLAEGSYVQAEVIMFPARHSEPAPTAAK